jgi:hypothetical protein
MHAWLQLQVRCEHPRGTVQGLNVELCRSWEKQVQNKCMLCVVFLMVALVLSICDLYLVDDAISYFVESVCAFLQLLVLCVCLYKMIYLGRLGLLWGVWACVSSAWTYILVAWTCFGRLDLFWGVWTCFGLPGLVSWRPDLYFWRLDLFWDVWTCIFAVWTCMSWVPGRVAFGYGLGFALCHVRLFYVMLRHVMPHAHLERNINNTFTITQQ